MEKQFVMDKVNLEDFINLVSEACCYVNDDNRDALRDTILEIHSLVYPDNSHIATPEENAAICANEPKYDRLLEKVKTELALDKALAYSNMAYLIVDEMPLHDKAVPDGLRYVTGTEWSVMVHLLDDIAGLIKKAAAFVEDPDFTAKA